MSVKIRSDEEIDNYKEEQFIREKQQMEAVSGFTLIDYIKSSIEILMNMKMDENENQSSFAKSKHYNKKPVIPKKKEDTGLKEMPKLDMQTPTSSILDL